MDGGGKGQRDGARKGHWMEMKEENGKKLEEGKGTVI
jgi:hypothetical protein